MIQRIQTEWIVLTGAPCSGKTTIVRELRRLGFSAMDEVARTFIEREIAAGRTLEELRRDEGAFQHALIADKLRLESELDIHQPIFLDRAFPDSVAYFTLHGLDPASVCALCDRFRYRKVYLLERLPYHRDAARNEEESVAQELEQLLMTTYRNLGYEPVVVPRFSTDKETSISMRVAFVLEQLR